MCSSVNNIEIEVCDRNEPIRVVNANQMDKNSLRVTNQKTEKWSCDQKGKLSNRTTTSAGELGTSVVVVVMNLM